MAAVIERARPEFIIQQGMKAEVHGRPVMVADLKAFDCVIVRDILNGETKRVRAVDIHPLDAPVPPPRDDPSNLSDAKLDPARKLQAILQPLLENPRRTKADVIRVGQHPELKLSATAMYDLIKRYRNEGLMALMPFHPSGGAGKKRLDSKVEEVIELGIKFYCSAKQPSLKKTMEQIRRMCRQLGLKCPDRHTVSARIDELPVVTQLRGRGHSKRAALYVPKTKHFDDAVAPRSVVQIDHKKLDIILVDKNGHEIGRPWLTLVMDVCTRMALGMHLTLDDPSAISVGMAMIHAIFPKEDWLKERGIDLAWDCWGFPDLLHADNGKDFRGEMLLRAAEIHGFSLQFRRIYTAPDGGHIERLFGTVGNEVHWLDGSTFSNPQQLGDNDPSEQACWTLRRLEREIVFNILSYHQDYHEGIKMPPIAKWNKLHFGDEHTPPLVGALRRPKDDLYTRLSFHPFECRTIQDTGVRINNHFYFDDVLTPFVRKIDKATGKTQLFTFRYDPSDTRFVWFQDPEAKRYHRIRDMDSPNFPISKREDALVQAEIRRSGRALVDHATIARIHRLRRENEEEVLRTRSPQRTKKLRRDLEKRRNSAELRVVAANHDTPTQGVAPNDDVRGFDIEDM